MIGVGKILRILGGTMLSSKMFTSAPVSTSAWILEFVVPIRTSAISWLLERVWMVLGTPLLLL